jgi:hypothetical protein
MVLPPPRRDACNGKHRWRDPVRYTNPRGKFPRRAATIWLVTAVSWKMIEHGWSVRSSDGEDVGVVFLVVGDENVDIFDGLAITHHKGFAVHNYADLPHYVEASQVASIDDSGEVTLAITADEARGLPVHDPPASAEIVPEDASVADRVRTGIEHLTGGDHTN